MNMPLHTTVLTVDLLRHGQPEGGERYRGALDDPLNAEGWEQMRQGIGDHTLATPWTAVLSSPLRRCADFAATVAESRAIPLYLDERLRELSFGAWEGCRTEELLQQDRARLLAFWRDPWHNPPPGGEPLPMFQQRVSQCLEAQLTQDRGDTLLIVTHGGVIRVLIALALDMPMTHLSRILVPYASMTRLRFDRTEGLLMPRLVSHIPLP